MAWCDFWTWFGLCFYIVRINNKIIQLATLPWNKKMNQRAQSQNNLYRIAQKKQQVCNFSRTKKFEKLAVYSPCKVSWYQTYTWALYGMELLFTYNIGEGTPSPVWILLCALLCVVLVRIKAIELISNIELIESFIHSWFACHQLKAWVRPIHGRLMDWI